MKRTRYIDLNAMRKAFAIKPLALGISAVFLSACGNQRHDTTIYTNADECADANPDLAMECETAYREALEEAERTGPKYGSMRDCEYDFGYERCRPVNHSGGSFFMPFMAGYMLSSMLDGGRYYRKPLFTSYSRYSPYRYRWIGAGGYDYGDLRKRNLKVSTRTFDRKPTITRTIKRGGFGSSVRAKSSWGSGKKSWGG